jgi:hypothetical protein
MGKSFVYNTGSAEDSKKKRKNYGLIMAFLLMVPSTIKKTPDCDGNTLTKISINNLKKNNNNDQIT